MAFHDFVRYAERLVSLGVKSVILTGGGEPTINQDFGKITNWLERKNIPYGINTNMIKKIECSPVFVKISIDSGIRENYKALRGVDALEKVVSNVKAFVKNKRGETKVGVQCVATSKENVLSFYELVKNIDVDYIYIRPIESCNNEDVSGEDVESWLSCIDDERLQLSFKFNFKSYKPKHCYANWSVITLNCVGDVMYCCHKPSEIVGHIMDDDILAKKERWLHNGDTCETPCRLSGANHFLDGRKIENDYMFI